LARDAFPDVNNGRTYIFLSPIQEIGRTRRKRQTPSGKYVWRAGYDRFDVVSGLAERGGGYDCSTYAAIAKSELGKIRDETLVLPSLQSSEQDEREAAIACLAFLGGDASLAALRVTAGTDPSPGLRRAAIWAYGFAGGEDAIMFARQRHEADGDEAVKAWITRSLALDNPCWWRM
ncbi:MAG: HEAT repeat domain-containing protein, partial [Gemmatimonadaceae bacterium]